jgi:hypothetical protein
MAFISTSCAGSDVAPAAYSAAVYSLLRIGQTLKEKCNFSRLSKAQEKLEPPVEMEQLSGTTNCCVGRSVRTQ